jgi:16S rRNA pseudouridine516 synthase
MRLDKFICKSTELSKDEVVKALQRSQVKIDHKVFTNGATQVHANNTVLLNDTELRLRPFRYLLFHKPANTLCSNIDEKYPSIFNFIDIEKKSELHIVGRLDVDTTGLVLITDDGNWTFKIIKPEAQCKKIYRVQLRDPLSWDAISKLEQGILLPGTHKKTLPAKIEVVAQKEVLLSITEGRFHQVKRMFRAVGNRVKGLHREKIGTVLLDVNSGQWRYLTADEISSFE